VRKLIGALIGTTMVAALLSPTLVHAQAPAAVRGKSVTASWTEERIQRLSGETDFSPRSIPMTLNVYISSEGRVFVKRTALGSAPSSRRPRASGSRESVDASGNQSGRVSGHTLIVTNTMGGGARMARIEFNQDFSSCTTNVIVGREGADTIAKGRSLASGRALEIKSATVSGTSCSVQNGNVFGQ